MQAATLMSPDPIQKGDYLEHAVYMWTERNITLESDGKQYGLAPLYKLIALTTHMVGRASEHFYIWGAIYSHEEDTKQ